MSVETSETRLLSLQALRAIAALFVVLFHATEISADLTGVPVYSGFWNQGWAGVDLFFVISGFIMVWVAGDRTAALHTTVQFLYDRITRIYPIWLIYCGLMSVYFLFAYGQVASPTTHSSTEAGAALFKSLLLWPQGYLPVLTVGWTLVFEMGFYAIFAVLLLFPNSLRAFTLSLWAAYLLTVWYAFPVDTITPDGGLALLSHPLCLEFLIGAGAAYLLKHTTFSTRAAVLITVISITAFTASMYIGPELDIFSLPQSRVLLFGIPAGFILTGIVSLEQCRVLRTPNWLKHIGDASYTLYLSHLLLLLVLKRIFERLDILTSGTALSVVGFVLISLILTSLSAVALYQVIERPLLRMTRRRPIKLGT